MSGEMSVTVPYGIAARLIEEFPKSVGRYQFTHALIQETLSEEITLTRRVRLHARIAEALKELYGEAADSHAPELAHRFSKAEAIHRLGLLPIECLLKVALSRLIGVAG